MSTTAASCFKGAVRRAEGFVRYALSIQYHGGSFLGVSYQGPDAEDCIVSRYRHRKKRKKATAQAQAQTQAQTQAQPQAQPQPQPQPQQLIRVDLRGHRSVEGRLREALDDLYGRSNWENIQVSSRTDRGVHALKNTLHVDIRTNEHDRPPRESAPTSADNDDGNDDAAAAAAASERRNIDRRIRRRRATGTNANNSNFSHSTSAKTEQKLRNGLNFYLSRQYQKQQQQQQKQQQQQQQRRDAERKTAGGLPPPDPKLKQNPMMNELRILGAVRSPEYMENSEEGKARGQPHRVDWNARFSATQRTYVYRLMLCPDNKHNGDDDDGDDGDDEGVGQPRSSSFSFSSSALGIPFEWDRAWCLAYPLDVRAMQAAAKHLEGTHDFSAFRGRLCQRSTPVVTLHSVAIDVVPVPRWCGEGNPRYSHLQSQSQSQSHSYPQLVTLSFAANSFLYRQVRNMVGCLVEVGKQGGRLAPDDVRDLVRLQPTKKHGRATAAAAASTKNNSAKSTTGEIDGSNADADANYNAQVNANPPNGHHDHSNAVADSNENSLASIPRRYTTAPPQGLFLVDVQHGSFRF